VDEEIDELEGCWVVRCLGFEYEKDIPYECNRGSVLRDGIQCRLRLKE